MELNIELKPEDVQKALQEVLIQQLQPEARDRLVSTAIAKLLEGNWNTPSELQRTMNYAVQRVAGELIGAELEKPENRERIRALVAEAWEKAFADDKREALVEQITKTIVTHLFGRAY